MKYISIITLALIIAISACCDNTTSDQPKKERDQPNLDAVAPTTSTASEKPAANPNRKPSTPEELETAKKILAAASEDEVAAVNAKQLFKNYCAICHGITGDLNVNGATDLTASTLGIEERVAQVYHGRGLMTPFRGLLKDHEIVAVTKYI